jgi:hypothetical protein
MQKIEPHIKKYIDESVNIASKKFGDEIRDDLFEYTEESKRHMSVVLEKFDNSLSAFREVAPKIPTEERIRAIVHEEIHPLDIKLGLCIVEMQEHRKELNGHERRITKLEDLEPA